MLARASLAAAAITLLLGAAGETAAKDYLLTAVKTGQLVLVDAAARKVERTYDIPNPGPGALTITPSPDGKIAYTIVNRWESISGIDLDSGKEVFRAELSKPEERTKAMFGMDVTPDGSQLAVYVSSVKLGLGEYEVQPTRIAFYDTSAGSGALPLRTIPAPRQITLIMFSKDGSKLYAMGRALYVIDPANGDILETHKTQTWERPNFYPPDILDVWSQWEQAGVFSTPYYTARSDMDLADPAAYWTGVLTLDLASGEFKIVDVENTEVFYFSSVVNPVRRNEVYGVYNTIAKMDVDAGKTLASTELDHSYYDINIASDGSEVYVGGTMGNIAVYSTDSLERLGSIDMPGGADMALSSLRVIQR